MADLRLNQLVPGRYYLVVLGRGFVSGAVQATVAGLVAPLSGREITRASNFGYGRPQDWRFRECSQEEAERTDGSRPLHPEDESDDTHDSSISDIKGKGRLHPRFSRMSLRPADPDALKRGDVIEALVDGHQGRWKVIEAMNGVVRLAPADRSVRLPGGQAIIGFDELRRGRVQRYEPPFTKEEESVVRGAPDTGAMYTPAWLGLPSSQTGRRAGRLHAHG